MKWDYKKFWKESNTAFVIKNLLLAFVLFIVFLNIVLYAIDGYTHHGEAETVPDLRGKYIEEAEIILSAKNLRYQVIDSMYDRMQPFGAIMEQTPPANSTLKHGRPIYLIINAKTVRQVPLPDVRDVSYRQAEAMLSAVDLEVERIEYEPSEYKDLVLDVTLNQKSLESGMRIPEGTSLVLVVGAGTGTENVFVPDILGLGSTEARNLILGASLVQGAVDYDVEPLNNEETYVVYKQEPKAGTWSKAGARVDVWLSTDKSKISRTDNTNTDEEDFF